jgi:phosphatidylserine/phosphatidylglycerophosphate/cardiolipin synthase-like enzyme
MNDVSTQQFSDRSLLKPGQNCWRVERATYASMVVDCGNYYRDLHESIMKAKHSIFILGWDIDSRVRLVRGDHKKNADDPETLYALIVKKASENPDLQVYMNQWNNTVLFSSDREFLPALKWRKANLPNIHFRLDRVIPFHGSQHQKVIVIDDEVAYTGGMDIGIKRWDCRLHKPFNEHRCDPIKVTDEEPIMIFKSFWRVGQRKRSESLHANAGAWRQIMMRFLCVPIKLKEFQIAGLTVIRLILTISK